MRRTVGRDRAVVPDEVKAAYGGLVPCAIALDVNNIQHVGKHTVLQSVVLIVTGGERGRGVDLEQPRVEFHV